MRPHEKIEAACEWLINAGICTTEVSWQMLIELWDMFGDQVIPDKASLQNAMQKIATPKEPMQP